MWRTAGVRVRSTVAATALLAVLVLAGAVTGLLLLRSTLYSVDEETGTVQSRLVRLSVTAAALTGSDATARQTLDTAVGAQVERGSHIQVLDADGNVVARSARLAGLPALSTLRPPSARIQHEVILVPALDEGHHWVVTVLGAEVEAQEFYVVVAESTADADRVLRWAGVLLAVGSPLLLAAIGVATWTFVGRSLRPVEAIRASVEGITARGLDGRVPVPPGEDEVSRLAATMNAMLVRLEAAQVSQRRFVADASHELRSPVATLRAAADVWAGSGGTLAEFTTLVASESSRLETLVTDLLTLARADEGRLVAAPQDVDLDEVVEVETARLRAVSGLTIHASIVPVRVSGDPLALARALRNLTDNAVRHATSTVELELTQEHDVAVLRVGDDGPGIPAAERERVFERFVRLDESRQRGSGGTGLGLAIVAETVAAQGGSVLVRERRGGGSVLEVRMPVRVLQPPSAASR